MSVVATLSGGRGVPEPDVVEFPRVAAGLSYELNWSLAGEKLTTRGEAYRNASAATLLTLAPRGSATVHKMRNGGRWVSAPATAGTASSFATDTGVADAVMGVEEFEARLNAVRDDCLSWAPQLFVQDGTVGGSRETEIRVRFITDSAVQALAVRSLLHRTPLYDPQMFPRAIIVYSATLAGHLLDKAGATYTVVDVDPASAAATVLAAGDVGVGALTKAIATAAGTLAATGGYRHRPGGWHVPNLVAAREAGELAHYMRDGHYYPGACEPHPDLLLVPGAHAVAAANGDGSVTLVTGPARHGVAEKAAAAGRLVAHDYSLWHAQHGASSLFAAAVSPKPASPLAGTVAFGDAAAVTPLPSLSRKWAGKPTKAIIAGASGDAAGLAASLGLTGKASEKWAARSVGMQVTAAASADDALRSLGL